MDAGFGNLLKKSVFSLKENTLFSVIRQKRELRFVLSLCFYNILCMFAD